jgi:hypothetical protein
MTGGGAILACSAARGHPPAVCFACEAKTGPIVSAWRQPQKKRRTLSMMRSASSSRNPA